MKFATSTFEGLVKSHPEWSSWTCFCETVIGRKYSKNVLEKKLSELVEKSDFEGSSKKELVEYLFELSGED
jgi:hypothetical protein